MTLYISVQKPKLDLFSLRFNHNVEKILKKLKTMDEITDCWAVDMTSGFVNQERRDVAIIASVSVVTDTMNSVSKIENVIKVDYDIGDSLIY